MSCGVCQESCMYACELFTQCGTCESCQTPCQLSTQCGTCLDCQSSCQTNCISCEGHPCESACQDYCMKWCLDWHEECGACEDIACQDDPCMGPCQEPCENNCVNNCESPGAPCQKSCQVDCMDLCQDVCQDTCLFGCQSCFQACQDSCQSSCLLMCIGEGQSCANNCMYLSEYCIGCQFVGEECLGYIQACDLPGLAPEFEFDWTTDIYSGGLFYGSSGLTQYPITAAEWNEFTVLINNKRAAMNMSMYPFSEVSIGTNFTADIINQAISAINQMGGSVSSVSSGGTIYASTFLNLRDEFNDIYVPPPTP